MSVSCERCVSSCRDLCVGLITRPVQSYRVSRISLIVIVTAALTHYGPLRNGKSTVISINILTVCIFALIIRHAKLICKAKCHPAEINK